MTHDIVSGAAAQSAEEPRRGLGIHVLLLVATLLTTTWAGALHQGVNILREPARWSVGVSYALAILAILGIHEMGHYVVARRRGVSVTLPYFIPAPVYLGTFGAFIQMRGRVRDRPTYFDVAVAGPLAGLVAALIALAIGFRGEVSTSHGGIVPASSILVAGMHALFGSGPVDQPVTLGALAFAGWIGLQVTALNLIPVGQLDGGHIGYALLGRERAARVGTGVVWLMLAAGILISPHWLMWGLLVWLIAGGSHPAAVDESRALDPGRRVLAFASFAFLLLIVLPWPR